MKPSPESARRVWLRWERAVNPIDSISAPLFKDRWDYQRWAVKELRRIAASEGMRALNVRSGVFRMLDADLDVAEYCDDCAGDERVVIVDVEGKVECWRCQEAVVRDRTGARELRPPNEFLLEAA